MPRSVVRVVAVMVCLVTSPPLFSQNKAQVRKSHRMDRELEFTYDNDVYLLTDRYYTSGLNVAYSKLIRPESNFYRRFSSKRSDSSKLVTRYHYGHSIYTPNGIKKRDFNDFDRPYAGWHHLRFEVMNFPNVHTANTFELEVVGRRSGLGNFQEWWHNAFNIVQPRGWQYQISSEPILNFSYNRTRNWRLTRKIQVMTNSGMKIGNGQNRLNQEVTLRLGKFNALNNSSIMNSRVSHFVPQLGEYLSNGEEAFVFYGLNANYILSNILIQGSLFNNESPHTEDIHNLVFVQRWGFLYSSYYVTFYFTYYRLGKEVVGGRSHRYINLNLAFRF